MSGDHRSRARELSLWARKLSLWARKKTRLTHGGLFRRFKLQIALFRRKLTNRSPSSLDGVLSFTEGRSGNDVAILGEGRPPKQPRCAALRVH